MHGACSPQSLVFLRRPNLFFAEFQNVFGFILRGMKFRVSNGIAQRAADGTTTAEVAIVTGAKAGLVAAIG